MSTRSAPWPKWPSQWLKRYPNLFEEAPGRPLVALEKGTPSGPLKAPSERGKGANGAVFRFEDFVVRPLRSSTLSRAPEEGPGRPKGEESGGGDRNDPGSLGRTH
jgi:hypothetical protein